MVVVAIVGVGVWIAQLDPTPLFVAAIFAGPILGAVIDRFRKRRWRIWPRTYAGGAAQSERPSGWFVGE